MVSGHSRNGNKYRMGDVQIFFRGFTLTNIVALRSFGDVKEGDHGGFVGSPSVLSQTGASWVYPNAIAMPNSMVCDNARLRDYSILNVNCAIYGNHFLYGREEITDTSTFASFLIQEYTGVYLSSSKNDISFTENAHHCAYSSISKGDSTNG